MKRLASTTIRAAPSRTTPAPWPESPPAMSSTTPASAIAAGSPMRRSDMRWRLRAEAEEARGGAHLVVPGGELVDRAGAQLTGGAVEQRDVDPAALQRRPPAQAGGVRLVVVQAGGVR